MNIRHFALRCFIGTVMVLGILFVLVSGIVAVEKSEKRRGL